MLGILNHQPSNKIKVSGAFDGALAAQQFATPAREQVARILATKLRGNGSHSFV
jgi:hypothetical protein